MPRSKKLPTTKQANSTSNGKKRKHTDTVQPSSNKKQELDPRHLLLQELSTLKPEKLTLQAVFTWETKCATDKLAQAILIDVVTHASFGLPFSTMANTLVTAVNDRTFCVVGKKKFPLLWTSLAIQLREIGDQARDITSLWKHLNREEISPDMLVELLKRLDTAMENSCTGAGNGMIPWSKLRVLAEPLMTLSNPTTLDILDMIEAVREAPMVSMDCAPGDHELFIEKWLAFLDRNPAVKAYTDPVYLFVVPAPIVANPGLAGLVGLFPPPPAGPPVAPVMDIGGAVIPGLYTGQPNSANIVAHGLRTHYATPPGAPYPGGAGPAQHILMFNTAAAVLTQV